LEHEKEPQHSESWGFLYILLFVFAFLFGRFSSKRETPIKKVVNGIQPQDNTANAGQGGQNIPSQPIQVMIESFPPSSTPPEEHERHKRWENRREWGNFTVGVLTFFGLLAYTCVSYNQLSEAKTQRKEAEMISTARIIVKEHTMEFSPWELNPKMTHTKITLTIKNASGTVANDIFVDSGGCGSSIYLPHGVIEIQASPRPGDGLAPQDTKTYIFDCVDSGNYTSPDAKVYTSSSILVSYRDIYGNTANPVPDCVVFEPRIRHEVVRCDTTYKYK